ncbi:MAG: hypothetical protein FWF77_07305 [Defluviitaleaceae bacterium]|nr:hypothetical protein [Defluviitaleaceae bacterium]
MLDYKFAFVACCFILALFSRVKCISEKDWGLLSCGLFFTLCADYFLVLRNEHLAGVAVFCFVHVFYILRARHALICKRWGLFFGIAAVIWVGALAAGSVVGMAGLYACLFAVNLYVNAKARRWLITAGLALFALCDISVGLYNLSHYLDVTQYFSGAFMFIWIFYIPALGILAVSALDFSGTTNSVS